MKVAVVATVLALAGTAVAQPGATPPMTPPAPGGEEAPPAPAVITDSLDPSTALWWSLGGTLASYGAVSLGGMLAERNRSEAAGVLSVAGAVGIFVAPSFGHWYAGTIWTRGMGLRVGSLGVGLTALVVGFSCGHSEDAPADDCDGQAGVAIGLLLGAAVMFVGGTVDDIVQAPRRARRVNLERRYALVPMLDDERAGLVLAGRF